MANNNDVAMRKRQQIDSSKRTMFIAVAIAAFASGIALVVAFFLAQQIWFHGTVIAEKQSTLDTINKNLAVIDDLEGNVRALSANEALNSAKVSDESSALQVILDALPAEANSDALGASLQVRFAGTVEGLTIESLSVDTTTGDATGSSSSSSSSDSGSSIGFRMSVSGTADGLKELLMKFERSIRVIELTSVEVQAGGQGLTMDVVGRAYYEPAQTVELETKVVKP